MTRLLTVVFFLSGASALVFETLWFRQAGISLGNSVWASSLVLASFMGGLAIGNAGAARWGNRLRNPIRFYAVLELAIGIVGLGIVILSPRMNVVLRPLFESVVEVPWLLNLCRLSVAFLLLLVPTAAMGATLPVVVQGVCRRQSSFGEVLGLLYGFNTLGAVAGTLLAETVLIRWLGVTGTGLAAAACNTVAALFALAVSRSLREDLGDPATGPSGPVPITPPWPQVRLLSAAFLSGGLLLALEVVWFRFLQLFTFGSSLIFAVMLAVVLSGIGVGGLVASWRLRTGSGHQPLSAIAFACGALVIAGYAAFGTPVLVSARHSYAWLDVTTVVRAFCLMFPTALLSGILFPLMGQALKADHPDAARAAGRLTLANTVGAMVGSLLGGFVLLPGLGMERSLLALGGMYGLVAVLCLPRPFFGLSQQEIRVLGAAGGAWILLMAWFPHGLMTERLFPMVAERVTRDGSTIVAAREGLTETILYTQRSLLGKPVSHRMVTNSHSMSGTDHYSKQYMKAFVYLPVALHPRLERALLISFGCGITAKALTDTSSLKRIDVVDISGDVLDLNRVVFPRAGEGPLDDPRVKVHLEDGRFFLQTTREKYDLITGEPPPPQAAGVVNLYTREYFQLIHDRLAPGGMATYWLPLHSLTQSDSRAIIRAFRDVFNDASLWFGSGDDWILLGIREPRQSVTSDEFRRQWQDPRTAPELAALGFETPEQLCAHFLADGPWLRELTRKTPPLVDDFPYRLSCSWQIQIESRIRDLLDPEQAWKRFQESPHVAELIPDEVRRKAHADFAAIPLQHDLRSRADVQPADQRGYPSLHRVLTGSTRFTLPLWILGTSVDEQRIVAEAEPSLRDMKLDQRTMAVVYGKLGDGALARRDFASAVRYYEQVRSFSDEFPLTRHVYALCLASRHSEAKELARAADRAKSRPQEKAAWQFLNRTFGLNSAKSPAITSK